jgi:hypothetical protein
MAKYQNGETLVFQTYIFPKGKFANFVDVLRETAEKDDAPIVLVLLANLNEDETVMLSSASGEDTFSITLALVQRMTPDGDKKVSSFNREMIGEVIKLGGTIHLAHRMNYSKAELRQLYPQADEFFALKRKYDPSELFSNYFYEKYGKAPGMQR